MATFNPSLVSVDLAKEWCQVVGNKEDRLIGELVRSASRMAENELTARKLKSRVYAAGAVAAGTGEDPFLMDGTGKSHITLPEYPVTSVTKVEFLTADNPEFWEEQALATYPVVIDPEIPGRIFYRAHAFPRGSRNVKVSAVAGEDVTQNEDLVSAVKSLVLALYKQKDKQLAGIASRTFEGQTVVYDPAALPELVERAFKPFRRMAFV